MALKPSDDAGKGATIPSQKRRVVRLHCSYQVKFESGGQDFKATVLDMGLQGMRLEVPIPVETGNFVTIQYDSAPFCYDVNSIRARVVWCRQKTSTKMFEIGVAYADPGYVVEQSWVRYLLCVFNLDGRSVLDRRRNVRIKTVVQAEISIPESNHTTAVTLFDLGVGGALFEGPTDLPVGASIRLEARLRNLSEELVCEGHIVRTRRSTNLGKWIAAIRFGSPEPRHYEMLGQFLSGLLDEERAQA